MTTRALAKAISTAKDLWLAMGLTTLQPKWHLTFDGHLLHQFVVWRIAATRQMTRSSSSTKRWKTG
jgi:hypothetical protein